MANTIKDCTNINLLKESQLPASPSEEELWAVELPINIHFIGEIVSAMVGASYVPDGCLPCDGSEYTKAQFPDLWNNYLTTTEVISKTWYAWTFDNQLDTSYTVYTESATPSVGDNVYRFDSAGTSYVAYSITAVGSGTITVNYRTGLECPRNSAADTTTTSSAPTKLNTCSYTEYQTAITQVGFCDKFAVDTTNNKFKVPLRNTYRKIIKASRNTNPGYNLYDDGWIEQWGYSDNTGQGTRTATITLPVAMMDTNYFVFRTEGRAAAGNAPGIAWISGIVLSSKTATSFQYSTDQYSYVAGDCWKVMGYSSVDVSSITSPREFVVVANGQINQSVMDWAQWASSLTAKANTDFSNMNPTSTAKETIVGWSMPDFTAKIETQETTYTAPSKGWVYVMAQGGELKVSINGSQLAHGTRSGIYYNVCYSLAYMVNTGDVVTVTGIDTARETPLIAFYPCKGVSSSGGGVM